MDDLVQPPKVIVLRTHPETILDDYQRLMLLGEYKKFISKEKDTLLKLNVSWTKHIPACSSQPWRLEGVIRTLLEDGFYKEKLFPVEDKTVVTDPIKEAMQNKWLSVLKKYDLPFVSLPEVEWINYHFKGRLSKLDKIFPEGIQIPKMFVGKNMIHLPTVKAHGHSITTGAIKNSFRGLLKEIRHYAYKYVHEVLVDLMIIQKEIHPGIFSIMDGTVCGDGAGPRTLVPKIKNIILASGDSVAIDAIAAKMMGFDPMEIPYIRLSHEMELGVGKPEEIEIVGEDISNINFGFGSKRSLVI